MTPDEFEYLSGHPDNLLEPHTPNRATSETYLTDQDDQVPRCPVCKQTIQPGIACYICGWPEGYDDGEAAIERERETHRKEFAAKLRGWRESRSIPNYGGPRAAK